MAGLELVKSLGSVAALREVGEDVAVMVTRVEGCPIAPGFTVTILGTRPGFATIQSNFAWTG